MAGRTHFLIVAVENYTDSRISKVHYAKADAEELVKAWQNLGYDASDFVVLINGAATKTAIEANLKKLSARAHAEDRIIIFFAGHGSAVNGDNIIIPVDAQLDMLTDTCVSINHILGHLKKAESERNLMFLDCCHSGFEPGEHIRRVTTDFSVEDLADKLKGSVYCVGFASCKSSQQSIGHPIVKHGVWTHFLIEALSGNAEDAYEGPFLVSDKLQSYLRQETAEFLNKHTVPRHSQTAMAFGSFSDRFVIEDLKKIFDERAAAKKATAFNMTSIVILDTKDGDIKSLPGFIKRNHVPDRFGSAQNSFVQSRVGNLVYNEIEEMSVRIKDSMDYTRKEITVECNEGDYYGSIETPHFTYSVEISQSDKNFKEYTIKRSLSNVDSDIINNPDFNDLFDAHFRELSFNFGKKINTEKLIDRLEPMRKTHGIKLDFKPTDTSTVTIKFPGSTTEIVIEPYSINITVPKSSSPEELVNVYRETRGLLDSAKINLLEPSK